MLNIFDQSFNGLPRFYRGWVMPDVYENVVIPPARLENWDADDLEAYCGGEYAKPGTKDAAGRAA